ncbi:hypothetical protein BDZ97DRAFT_1757575 [Flammula alnicola]|nr:hypothetical protein BDZ97DRAFT_1757575 [Flammula alnicola]
MIMTVARVPLLQEMWAGLDDATLTVTTLDIQGMRGKLEADEEGTIGRGRSSGGIPAPPQKPLELSLITRQVPSFKSTDYVAAVRDEHLLQQHSRWQLAWTRRITAGIEMKGGCHDAYEPTTPPTP